MAELSLPCEPRLHEPYTIQLGGPIDGCNTVRAYRDTTESVCLQLRMSRRYVTVSLPFDVARQLADHIIKECDEGKGAAA